MSLRFNKFLKNNLENIENLVSTGFFSNDENCDVASLTEYMFTHFTIINK